MRSHSGHSKGRVHVALLIPETLIDNACLSNDNSPLLGSERRSKALEGFPSGQRDQTVNLMSSTS